MLYLTFHLAVAVAYAIATIATAAAAVAAATAAATAATTARIATAITVLPILMHNSCYAHLPPAVSLQFHAVTLNIAAERARGSASHRTPK